MRSFDGGRLIPPKGGEAMRKYIVKAVVITVATIMILTVFAIKAN